MPSLRRAEVMTNPTPSLDAIDDAIEVIAERVPSAIGTPLDLRQARERAGRTSTASEAMVCVRRAWLSATTEPSNRLTESECAQVMRIFNESWLARGLEGTAVSDGTWAFRCARVNRAQTKRMLTELAQWARKGLNPSFVESCRRMRDEVVKKTESPYETYAQVWRGLEALRTAATTGVRNMVNDGASVITYDDALEYDKDLQKWIERCWRDNGLPPLDELPKPNEPFFASGMENDVVVTLSKRAPPRDRTQLVHPAMPLPKKSKVVKSETLSVTKVDSNFELPRSVKKETPIALPPQADDSEADSSVPATRQTEMNVVRHSVGVMVRVRCYGMDADVVIIPPFGLQKGTKTNGEMAAMVFRETQAAQQANTQPATQSERCVHNDGKAWRCPASRVDDTPFCSKHGPVKYATSVRVRPVSFTTQQGLEITYAGPPSACVIRSVASTPIASLDLLSLKDPENFEAHAWKIESQLKSCDGLIRRDGPCGRFRENAVVLERGGVWVPYETYEARLITLLPGTPPGSSVASETVLNQCIEDINRINASRSAANEGENDDSNEDPTASDGTNENSAPIDGSPGDDPTVKMPTGAREVRLRLAELHRQLNTVKREISGLKETGVEHAEALKREGGEDESEYAAFEQSINRALQLT